MKTILVIDDEHEIRQNIVRSLELCDYNTLSAENGLTGIILAKEHKPDLILSDIMMPDIDGFEVLKELQKNSETAGIPLLFLSAKSARIDIRVGMNLGADDFITKPFDLDELLQSVEARLEKAERFKSTVNERIEELRSTLRMTIPHEIRTPLNIVLGLSEFLKKNHMNNSPEDVNEMLGNINEAGKRLHRLFENYLFYANLEIISSNPDEIATLRKQKTSLSENIIKDIVMFRSHEADRHEDIMLDLSDAAIQMSEYYLVKIIEELLDNAFKFSDAGSRIKVTAEVKGQYYVLTFTDFGRGMTDNQIMNIGAYIQFERKLYEQQGTGLGLAIVQKIVKLHNGNTEIISDINNFTSVHIEIPLA